MIMFARTVIYYLDDPCSLGGGRRAADEPRDHLQLQVRESVDYNDHVCNDC